MLRKGKIKFSKLSNYLTSKTFWFIDILFMVCMVFLVKSAWGSLDYHSRWVALLLIQVRTKVFDVQEQEHIVSLSSKEGTSHRDI